jgi:hypothetical protein
MLQSVLGNDTQDPKSRHRYLDKAIEHYERGMLLDLNDYFRASNLPRLLRARGERGDPERAQAINELVVIACDRRHPRGRRADLEKQDKQLPEVILGKPK